MIKGTAKFACNSPTPSLAAPDLKLSWQEPAFVCSMSKNGALAADFQNLKVWKWKMGAEEII